MFGTRDTSIFSTVISNGSHVHHPRPHSLSQRHGERLRRESEWHLLSVHGRAIVAIACDPFVSPSSLATILSITPSEATAILADLVDDGLVVSSVADSGCRFLIDAVQAACFEITPGRVVADLIEVFRGPADLTS